LNTDENYLDLSSDADVTITNKGNVISWYVVNTPDPEDNYSDQHETVETSKETSKPEETTTEDGVPTSNPTVNPTTPSPSPVVSTSDPTVNPTIPSSPSVSKNYVTSFSIKNKASFTLKLKSFKKKLKEKGKWNKLVVTDAKGNKKTLKFKTK